MWGYWRNTSKYMAGSGLKRENAAYFEALTGESIALSPSLASADMPSPD